VGEDEAVVGVAAVVFAETTDTEFVLPQAARDPAAAHAAAVSRAVRTFDLIALRRGRTVSRSPLLDSVP
jgi:hypothetical protein